MCTSPKTAVQDCLAPVLLLAEQVSSISKSQLQDYKGHITDRSIMDAVTTASKCKLVR